MSLTFEWDEAKASENLDKHGVSFAEAATAFGDPLSLTIGDPDHSDGENRYILLGRTFEGSTLVVIHTERDDNIRIISARRATRHEIRTYEQESD